MNMRIPHPPSNGGFDNWYFEIIEIYRDCMTKQEAILRVEKLYNEQNDKKTQPTSYNNSNEDFCTNCGNKFTRKDSLMKHVKYRCKQAIQEINILSEKHQEIDNLKKYMAILFTLLDNP